MKHKKYTITIFFCSLFLLNACQKDIDLFVPDPVQPNLPDTNWVSMITDSMPVSLLKNSLLLPLFADSFVVGGGNISRVSPVGITYTFNRSNFVNSLNQSVTGNVQIQTLLLKKKGDMIRMDKPTTTNGNFLISGGQLLLRFVKDGAVVNLAQQATVSISYPDSGTSSLMNLYYGDESNPAFFNWIANADSTNALTASGQGYTIRSGRTGWIAAGQPVQTSVQASIFVTLPAQFSNANTAVYLVSQQSRTVIKMNGDAGIRKFTSGALPYGNNYTVIVLSKQGSNYFRAAENITPTTGVIPGTINQSINISPVITTLDNISAMLDSL